eukprot:TRINITY_DN1060_c0_g1_i1.p4 TRINITY_DN1060_c0_g1~~TRINITY_DN1060_c0_g1_i1.p4  ORF type:complete len:215 (-),score=19.00 TRINITY_DN1060_c0_g1_i1:3954-4598(-)
MGHYRADNKLSQSPITIISLSTYIRLICRNTQNQQTRSKMEPDRKSVKSELRKSKPELQEESKSVSKDQFVRTNFDFLYDNFHEPLTDVISKIEMLVGINKKNELKYFEHNEDTKAIEEELCHYAKTRNSEVLDLRLTYYYNNHSGTLNDTLKYILCFYKVLLLGIMSWQGVSEYLKENYDQAEKNYHYCFNLFDGDPQLYYNLGLTYMMYDLC